MKRRVAAGILAIAMCGGSAIAISQATSNDSVAAESGTEFVVTDSAQAAAVEDAVAGMVSDATQKVDAP